MRPKHLLLCFLLLPLVSFSQSRSISKSTPANDKSKSGTCPLIYLGINGGIENPNGLIGVSVDVAPISNLSVGAGLGLSSWGTKYFAEIRGYLGDCHRQWAGGIGITHNTGLRDFENEMPTSVGTMPVVMDLKPVTNMFFNLYRFWNLGARMNRVYFSFGYSFRLKQDVYSVTSPYELTGQSKDVMTMMAPGGVSLGVGFYFDVTGKKR